MKKSMKKSTKKMVMAALMTAFTCIATMILKCPTPMSGYVHHGDGMVLLCGIVLGPVTGMIAAGTGSMLADVFSGYFAWAPATFVIKALTAGIGGALFYSLKYRSGSVRARNVVLVISGIAAEAVMVAGYFLYEALLAAFAAGGFSADSLVIGAAAAAAGVPFNIVQGIMGIMICILLLPVLLKITDIREWISDRTVRTEKTWKTN